MDVERYQRVDMEIETEFFFRLRLGRLPGAGPEYRLGHAAHSRRAGGMTRRLGWSPLVVLGRGDDTSAVDGGRFFPGPRIPRRGLVAWLTGGPSKQESCFRPPQPLRTRRSRRAVTGMAGGLQNRWRRRLEVGGL